MSVRRTQSTGGSQQTENQMQFTQKKTGSKKVANIWILENGKKLKAVQVNIGISDNRFVELLSGDFKENDEVIVGMLGNGLAAGSTQGMNPFGPQRIMIGGGGGGRR